VDAPTACRDGRIAECRVEVVEPPVRTRSWSTSLGGKHVIARMRSDAPSGAASGAPFAFNMDKATFSTRHGKAVS
jgi:multiple sugar transport system ATP-binding protein